MSNPESTWNTRANKFREQLSSLSTSTANHSDQPLPKSRWSPSTTVIHSASTIPSPVSPPPPLPTTTHISQQPHAHTSQTTLAPAAEDSPATVPDMSHWNNKSNLTLDLERATAGPSNREIEEMLKDQQQGSTSSRSNHRSRFSFWPSRPTAPSPITPASDATSFVPTRVAPWRHLNVLRKPAPPVPVLPTTNPAMQTFYHETKPVHIHNHIDLPAAKAKAIKEKKQKKKDSRTRCWIIILIIIIIYLLANTIFLNVRVLNMPTPSTTAPVVSPTSPTSSGAPVPTSSTSPVSAEVTSCLSQFKLNAASKPTSYPCSSCAPILEGVPNDLSPSVSNPPVTGQGTVLQFCALSDIATSTANNTLQNVGWLANTNICTWKGVSCDGSSRVTSLTLVFPGVPATLPSSLSNLIGLQTLSITGNSVIPAGSISPSSSSNTSSILSLPTLQTLSIQSTALTGPLPDTIFSNSGKLTSLTLVNNPQLGQTLPSSLWSGTSALKSVVVNGQSLTDLGSGFGTSGSKSLSSLQTLDVSSNSLSGSIPDLSAFTSLVEVSFASNSFTSMSSSSSSSDDGFPNTVQTLSLAKNANLQGSVPGPLCASTTLSACDFRGTELGVNGGNATTGQCGSCLFGSA